MTETIGIIAGIFTCSAFVPQVYKVYKTKQVADISWGLAIMYWIGISLWLAYGILKQDITIIASNGFSLILSSMMLYAKHKFNQKC